jgi:hypothetical protein
LRTFPALDHGFTPATSLLQPRRLDKRPGTFSNLPVLWFDVEATRLTELAHAYGACPTLERPRAAVNGARAVLPA